MKRLFFPLFIFFFLAGTILFHQYATIILACVRDMGHWAPLCFIVFYILATLFFLPTLVLTFTGGVLFGPLWGTLINLIGACSGATLAFCISRYKLAHQNPLQHHRKFQQLIQGMDHYGWYFLALVRALPLLPFNLVNYGMGFTNMPLRTYIIVSLIFLTPTEILYTWCGYVGRQALMMPDISSQQLVLIAGLCVLFLSVVGKWFRSIQRKRQSR
ncbi:MAG: TVP38/TMEM64 family protein [Legionellaceae bacterium]|nr:TVP38/TMEM64 family protein [Legionellaceae bacterium]